MFSLLSSPSSSTNTEYLQSSLTWLPLLIRFEFAVDDGNIIQKQPPVCEVDKSDTSNAAPYSQSGDPVKMVKIYHTDHI